MRKPARLLLAGLATLLVGLLINFPARVAYQWFAPQELTLSGIDGSMWHGSAARGIVGGVYLTELSWRFRPRALLSGRLGFAIRSKPVAGLLDANVALGPAGSIVLSQLRGSVSLASFADLFPLAGIDGDLRLDFDKLVIDKGIPVEAKGTIAVANLVSRYLSPAPLGDYEAEFRTSDDSILGSVAARSGVLELADATIRLTTTGEYQFTGKIAAKPGAPAALRQQVQYLGSPDERGFREFGFEGRL